MTSFEQVGGRPALEQATVDAVQLLARSGIESVVLRGPPLVALLYEREEARPSIDVELLVSDLEAGSTALERAGYTVMIDWTPGMEKHAWTHVRADSVSIDLHRTLVGAEAPPDRVWDRFARSRGRQAVGAGVVHIPSPEAHLLIVVLYAAQHGSTHAQTLEDLRRALVRYDADAWREAADLASELEAGDAFFAGLALTEAGLARTADLGLEPQTSRAALLRFDSARPTTLGLDRLAQLRGSERRVYLLGKLFPPADFMRDWHPLARRGTVGLIAAYPYRLVWIAARLPSGIVTLLTAERRARAARRRRIRS